MGQRRSEESAVTRIVGLRYAAGPVLAGRLSADGARIEVITSLEEFWAGPREALERVPSGPSLPADWVELVPPVLPVARVICVGLNYLKHIAEGSFAGGGVPEYPTLFARWPAWA